MKKKSNRKARILIVTKVFKKWMVNLMLKQDNCVELKGINSMVLRGKSFLSYALINVPM